MIVSQHRELGCWYGLRTLELIEKLHDLRPIAVVCRQPQLVHAAESQQRLPDLRLPQQLLRSDFLGDRLIFRQRLLRPARRGQGGGGGDPRGPRTGITAEHPLAGGQLFVGLTQPGVALRKQQVDLSLQFARIRRERPDGVELFHSCQPLLPCNEQPRLQHADRRIRSLRPLRQTADRLLGIVRSFREQLDVCQRQQDRRMSGQPLERLTQRLQGLLRLALPDRHVCQAESASRHFWKQVAEPAGQLGCLVEAAVRKCHGEGRRQDLAIVGGDRLGAFHFLGSLSRLAMASMPPRYCQPGAGVLRGGFPQLFKHPLCGLWVLPLLGEDHRQEQRCLRDESTWLSRGVERLASRIEAGQTGGQSGGV